MKGWTLVVIAGAAAAIVAGCGGKSASSQDAGASATNAGVAKVSAFDAGPRAGESPADEAQAKRGEQLFKDKGCSACHAFGRRISCPDLNGVTMRRTAKWMENQILHPEKMVKEDPIARQLFAEYSLQMPNQGLTEIEARAVIEFLKHRNHETAEKE